jgi:hypothetical protein
MQVSSTGGAENGALEPRLAMVIDAWPMLSEHRRLIIVGIAKALPKRRLENRSN